jgi:hypothetical protein
MRNDPASRDENALAVPPESRSLHFAGDDEAALTRAEADVAGISRTPSVVYGEGSTFPNEADQRDANAGAETEP